MGLPLSQEFGGYKVFQVLVVSDNINHSWGAFKTVVPGPERLVNNNELFIVGVIIELWNGQGLGVVDNRPDLLIRTMNRENASYSTIRGVSLHNNWSIQNPMSEDRSGDESILQVLKERVTRVTKVSRETFVGETDQRSNNT